MEKEALVAKAKPKQNAEAADSNGTGNAGSNQMERLTNLVALLLIKGESQSDQLRTLSCAGFSNSEIARLLGLTPNAVNVALHRIRKR